MNWKVLRGTNFSGRSRKLREIASDTGGQVAFLGPYAEASLSGFAATVEDELQFYGVSKTSLDRPAGWLPNRGKQGLSSLSGGEQVMVALVCAIERRSLPQLIAIDSSLEQLDQANREVALSYIDSAVRSASVALIDNRLGNRRLNTAHKILCDTALSNFPLDLAQVRGSFCALKEKASSISLDSLTFRYPNGRKIFDDCSLSLKGGSIYRLTGGNGAGKTTLLKILTGVLRASSKSMYLDGVPYNPYRMGNSVIAYATQNPDEQWIGTKLQDDLRYRLRKENGSPNRAQVKVEDFAAAISGFGVSWDTHQHLMDLPRALRKRLSWLWPLSGVRPWIALDEPTIGQDDDATAQLAAWIGDAAQRGHGVLLITHDPRLTSCLSYHELQIGKGAIREF